MGWGKQLQTPPSRTHTHTHTQLPDGQVIKLGPERFESAEPLFRPELMGIETRSGGIAQMTFECINNSSRDVQSELFKHIVLSGGTTMLPGLPTRLEKELKSLYIKHKLGGNASKGGVCATRQRRRDL